MFLLYLKLFVVSDNRKLSDVFSEWLLACYRCYLFANI